jgi:hypothetical protein
MNGWTIYPLINDRNRSTLDSPVGGERRRVVMVEILLAGFRIPGFIEYSSKDDSVTFTIIKKMPNSSPGQS